MPIIPPTPNPHRSSRHPVGVGASAAAVRFTSMLVSLALLLLLPALGGCTSVGVYTRTVQAATELVVHRGLPRADGVAPATATPPAANDTITLQGYAFEGAAITISPPDVERLRVVLGARSSYASFTENKKCGGFHPDYALQWSDDERRYLTLICFGCDEFKLFGPEVAERYDMAPGVSAQLRTLLSHPSAPVPAAAAQLNAQ